MAAVRQHLARRRSEGVPFPAAWDEAMRVVDAGDFYLGCTLRPSVFQRWIRKHFAAAYRASPNGAGRLRIEPPEGSATPAMPAGEGLTARRRCAWGDGCERYAVAGRTWEATAGPPTPRNGRRTRLGPFFCKRHAEQLAQYRDELAHETRARKPWRSLADREETNDVVEAAPRVSA